MSSYVKMKSADVLAIVEPIIKDIEETRAEMLEDHIKGIQASRDWWRRFLPFLKQLSYADARKIACGPSGDNPIPDHQIYAWGVLGHARDLRAAAKTTDEVMVSASDLNFLKARM